MKSSLHFFVISLLTIGMGAAWLLNIFPALPNANWIWPLGMGLAGLLLLGLCGVNKLTIVTGPFLVIASLFTVMHQTGRFELSQQMPSMVIALGLLMLLSVVASVPAPGWANMQARR